MAIAALAEVNPVGVWRTISDVDGKPRGLVQIEFRGNSLTGKIVGSLHPGEDPRRVCEFCAGERRGKLLLGMQILGGLKQNPSQPLEFDGGWLLDPDSGNVYQAKATLNPDGSRLMLRGFIGVSMIGRTQTWYKN